MARRRANNEGTIFYREDRREDEAAERLEELFSPVPIDVKLMSK
jgi:hypothetical protein